MCVLVAVSAVLASSMAVAQTPAPDADRKIIQVRGDLYRAQDGSQTTVFLVSGDGIVVVDPLNVQFAGWLRAELETRFPGCPVKYVVYSHLDFDRIRGASVFKPPAAIIAQLRAISALRTARLVFPVRYTPYDRDANGSLDVSELVATGEPDAMLRLDANADQRLSPQEVWSEVVNADGTFAARRTLVLGKKLIELVYTGTDVGVGSSAIYFPDERVVFVAEHLPLTNPFANRSVMPLQVKTWTRTIAALDFDILISGNGDSVSHADLVALDGYVEALAEAVAAGLQVGRTLAQIQKDSRVNDFSGSQFATVRNADLAFLYQRTRVVVLGAYGAPSANYISFNTSLCDFASCRARPSVGPGGLAGVSLSRRQLRALVEVSRGSELHVSGVDRVVSFAENRRVDHLSFLGGYRTAPSGAFNVTMLGGVTYARMVTAGRSRGFGTVIPESYTYKGHRWAFTFGSDVMIPISPRWGVIAPIRLTRSQTRNIVRSTFDVHAGIGLTIAALRTVR